MSAYLDREPQPAPPLPFTVVEYEGDIFVRRRDGTPYRLFWGMGVTPEEFRSRCEWLCKVLNDTYDYSAREQIKRARRDDQAATAAFVGGEAIADLARTISTQAAE